MGLHSTTASGIFAGVAVLCLPAVLCRLESPSGSIISLTSGAWAQGAPIEKSPSKSQQDAAPAPTSRPNDRGSVAAAAWEAVVIRRSEAVNPGPSKSIEKTQGEGDEWVAARITQPVRVPARPQSAAETIRNGLDTGDDWRPFHGRELVVTDARPDVLEKAQSLGFNTMMPTRLHGLGLWVTTVSVPADADIEATRQSLEREMPGARVGVNQTYYHYRPATRQETANLQHGFTTIQRAPSPCPESRCFGPSLIRWHPSMSACAKGMRIGVIDTAIEHDHADFAGRRIKVGSFSGEHQRAPSLHGTGVLAVLGGNRSAGTPGLVPSAEFYVADVFFADGKGYLVSDTATLLRALNWLDMFQIKVVNMSLSGPNDPLLERAIAELSYKKGMIFVAAAGNEGPAGPPSYPAAYKDVIAVTAVSKDLRGYRYANHGNYIDVAAPGVDIWTALPGGGHAFQSGTSFAVPYVTSIVAAMYRSVAIKRKSEFLRRLPFYDLGPVGRDPIYGMGLILAPDECAPQISPPTGPLIGRGPTVGPGPVHAKGASKS